MATMDETKEAQAKVWKGAGGQAWVEAQAMLDRLFQPIEDAIVEAVEAEGARAVLDVGCGTGGTILALARRLGQSGRCVGIDLSEPMIEAARERARREGAAASFVIADAETHDFAPASFDMIVSRFGVMFFADPVRAFANLRRAAMPGAALYCVAWREAEENPFMTTAERAAAPLLPELPERRPDEPGQFAFGDARRVERILAASGWDAIAIRPVDFACTLPEAELIPYLTRLGPVGRALDGADEATRRRVAETVRPAFERYVHGSEVRFTAACWTIAARAPDR